MYIPYIPCPSLTYTLLPFLVAIHPGRPFLQAPVLLPRCKLVEAIAIAAAALRRPNMVMHVTLPLPWLLSLHFFCCEAVYCYGLVCIVVPGFSSASFSLSW